MVFNKLKRLKIDFGSGYLADQLYPGGYHDYLLYPMLYLKYVYTTVWHCDLTKQWDRNIYTYM